MTEFPALLVAVTGAPGEGRTRTLAAFAAAMAARGTRVAGCLAVAGERPDPRRGARSYRLRILGEPEEREWAVRDDSLAPPYRFDEGTRAHLAAWAKGLSAGPRPEVLVLDEFGPVEAAGGGLMALWPDLVAARPGLAVLSVRTDSVAAVEARLGRAFDLRLAASDPGTPARLRSAGADFGAWTRVGLWGGAAGAIELSLGSALHALKVPLRGAGLCSAQAAMLTFASARLDPPGRVAWVAFIAAGLKAFSPGGGRVRPMVAIAAQGALFAAAVQALGWNLAGVGLGGAAIGAWAALQGFLVQYLLLGQDLVEAYARVTRWLAEQGVAPLPSLPVLLAGWAAFHAALASASAVTAWRLRTPPARVRALLEDGARADAATPAEPGVRASLPRRVLREFARWHFWLPLALVGAVLLATGRPGEDVAWLVARFVAVGAVLFALLSLVQPARFAAALRRRGWWGPAAAFTEAWGRRRGGR
jgi:nucleoside-triphosphatase THEP1